MRKWLFRCALLVLCLIPTKVFAAEENWICVGGNLYDVTSRGSKVDLASITRDHLNYNSTLSEDYFNTKRNFGVNSIQFKQKYGNIHEPDYAFTAVSLNKKCNLHKNPDGSYKWTSCPTNAQYNSYNSPYTTLKFQKAISKFKFDGNGNFYLDISDLFDSTLLIRAVRSGGTANKSDYDYSSIQSMGWVRANEVYTLGSNGVRIMFPYNKNDPTVRLEFYINPNSGVDCAGAYVGSVDTATPAFAEVANPWKDSAICKSFRSGYSHIPTTPTNYKSLLIPECYSNTIDYFSERPYISESSIRAKMEEIDKMFQPTNEPELKQLQCHYNADGSRETAAQTKTFIMNPASNGTSNGNAVGDYWAASCTETVTIDYDQPKKVVAGAGFPYDVKLNVTRKCVPFVLRKVEFPEKCEYASECWGGPAEHYGTPGAGPNEEFDSCVSACDGGKYTKDCINQCYKKVYEEKDHSFAKGVKTSTFLDSIKVKQVAKNTYDCSQKTPTSPNYCYASKGWSTSKGKTGLGSIIYEVAATSNQQSNCNGVNSCTTFHGVEFVYLDGCNSATNPTICYEIYRTNPMPKCSDNPEEDGKILKEAAEQEYIELLAAIKKYETTENFDMSIVDSYRKDSKGNPLVTTSTSLENMVKVTGGVYTYPDTGLKYKETAGYSTQVWSNSGDAKNVPQIEVTKEYTIQLPQAVIDQITGQEKYVKTNYKIPANERDGGNKYYTDINSGTYNDFRKWTDGYSPLDERADTPFVGNNIAVVLKNIGTIQSGTIQTGADYTWDKIDLDCFYGLLNKRYIECDDGVCDMDCAEGDVCTGGIQYMFRQIDTKNMFPDRDPRWNWQYTSERDDFGYASEPSKVIERVQTLGDQVYNEENLDYNITITKENIRSIRRYNKSKENYQNYDMDCVSQKNGMQICESNMLENASYVKNFQRNTEIGVND